MKKKIIFISGFAIIVLVVLFSYTQFFKQPEIVCYPDGGSAQCFVSRIFNGQLSKLVADPSMFKVKDDGSEYLSWEFACEKYFDEFAAKSNEIYQEYTASNANIVLKESRYVCNDDDDSIFMYYKYRFGDHDLGFCYDGINQEKSYSGDPDGLSCIKEN